MCLKLDESVKVNFDENNIVGVYKVVYKIGVFNLSPFGLINTLMARFNNEICEWCDMVDYSKDIVFYNKSKTDLDSRNESKYIHNGLHVFLEYPSLNTLQYIFGFSQAETLSSLKVIKLFGRKQDILGSGKDLNDYNSAVFKILYKYYNDAKISEIDSKEL